MAPWIVDMIGQGSGRLANALAALTMLIATSSLSAHETTHPRWNRLVFETQQLTITATYDLDGGEPSQTLRRRFDHDGNGQLDGAEAQGLSTYLQLATSRWLKVRSSGSILEATSIKTDISPLHDPVDSTRALRATCTISFELPAQGSLHLLLQDQHPDRNTPVWFDLAKMGPWELESAFIFDDLSQAEAPAATQRPLGTGSIKLPAKKWLSLQLTAQDSKLSSQELSTQP